MSGDGEIDWEELARVMREEREDKLYPLLAIDWHDGQKHELVSAWSYFEYIQALGHTTAPCYVIDGRALLLQPEKYEGLKEMVRKLDASRGWK